MADLFAHGYALLIGVDQNQVAGWGLPTVAQDVAALARVLAHPQRCAYPPQNVRLLRGAAATRDEILDGLDWLHAAIRADPEATAVVYYSGHGWRDEAAPDQFYLVPYDVRADRLRFSALRAADLQARIAALNPARLLVVLDCCHAAGMEIKGRSSPPASLPRVEGGGALPPPGYRPAALPPARWLGAAADLANPVSDVKGLEMLARGRGRAVLSSSSGEQLSYVRRDRAMSVFTYHLIEALTGHARPQAGAASAGATSAGAETVLVSDLMGHVTRRVPETVRREQGAAQTPDFQVSGNFPVALLLGGKGLGEGERAPDPLGALEEEAAPASGMRVDTGGGLYVRGNLTNRGLIVGRDQHVGGDVVLGDKAPGEDEPAR